jgi:hypothetical protein
LRDLAAVGVATAGLREGVVEGRAVATASLSWGAAAVVMCSLTGFRVRTVSALAAEKKGKERKQEITE